MSNVIPFDRNKFKKDTEVKKTRLVYDSFEPLPDNQFGDRIQRIRDSLNKINELMASLKELANKK